MKFLPNGGGGSMIGLSDFSPKPTSEYNLFKALKSVIKLICILSIFIRKYILLTC